MRCLLKGHRLWTLIERILKQPVVKSASSRDGKTGFLRSHGSDVCLSTSRSKCRIRCSSSSSLRPAEPTPRNRFWLLRHTKLTSMPEEDETGGWRLLTRTTQETPQTRQPQQYSAQHALGSALARGCPACPLGLPQERQDSARACVGEVSHTAQQLMLSRHCSLQTLQVSPVRRTARGGEGMERR